VDELLMVVFFIVVIIFIMVYFYRITGKMLDEINDKNIKIKHLKSQLKRAENKCNFYHNLKETNKSE
jgi:Tfp pilus assembly protein PilO